MRDSRLKETSPVHPSHDRLSALLDAAVDGMVVIDGAGRITSFNPAAERLFGYTAAEILGHNVKMLMPNPYHDEHDQYLQRYLSTAQPHVIGIGREVIARRRDGSMFPIELSVGEFKSGSEHGFVGIIRDITARKRQEDALRKNSEELRLILESTPTAIAITDIDGRLVRINPAFQRLLGYSIEALAGQSQEDLVRTLVAEDDRKSLLSDIHKLYHTGESFRRDVRFHSRDAQEIHAMIYAGAVCNTDSQPRLMVSQIIDRSALFAAEHEAEELRAQLAHVSRIGTLGEMVSGIAHEVNQPLTAIANYANAVKRFLQSGRADPMEVAGTLEKISAQAVRAGQVIHGLRKLTRRRETERVKLDCNALIQEVSRLIEFELRFSEHELLLELDPTLPKVFGDGVQFQQVVLNLIRNALEAMKDGAQGESVTVTTSVQVDGYVEIVVSDTGPGLTPEVEERLFEPFFTTKPRGMGVGLSICKSIVSAMDGNLSCRLASTGGAEFVIQLPIVSE
ncbi:MAG: PAS domain S-box protein [Gammaproteobacteria bacterium]|nr:PAS domain S-box protein [Gammaproteobacteria bacterium]